MSVPQPREARHRRGPVREDGFAAATGRVPVLGVDPGARYTGLVLRDADEVLYAATLVRDRDATSPGVWALQVVGEVRRLLQEVCPEGTVLAVEGVSAPKGFKGGQRAPINPKSIVFAAVVFGAVIGAYPDAFIIAPGGNGSQHLSQYPVALVGRRPADLPGDGGGAGTRAHEQSAYDVAGKASSLVLERD